MLDLECSPAFYHGLTAAEFAGHQGMIDGLAGREPRVLCYFNSEYLAGFALGQQERAEALREVER